MQHPDSLLGRVFKAKYFPSGGFLEARIRSQPSYAWRSLLATRELLQEGLWWRVGDGKLIKIRGEKWLPCPSTYEVQSTCSQLSDGAKVCELINSQTGEWDASLTRNIFREEEAAVTCNIPIN